jgi:LacI family transcriptional regulator
VSSIRDVARLSGVSVATVSAVINEKGTVSAALSQRVKDAMRKLDYHPDQIARSLRTGRTDVIGIIVPDISNQFFATITRGVEDYSEKNGCSVILCDARDDSAREQKHLSTLYARRVDGVLLASSISQAGYDRLTRRRFPIVFLDAVPTGIVHDSVIVDNVEAARRATRHLIDLGHRQIAIIGGALERSVGSERLEGYRMAMQDAGILIPDSYVQIGDFHLESGHRCGSYLMNLTSPPTAIFACNNAMSLGLLRALADLGIRCPADVSVVGFDDADWALSFNPRLTCISQPTYEMGQRATEMLLDKISKAEEDQNGTHPNVVLRAELRVRESTAPPQLRRKLVRRKLIMYEKEKML